MWVWTWTLVPPNRIFSFKRTTTFHLFVTQMFSPITADCQTIIKPDCFLFSTLYTDISGFAFLFQSAQLTVMIFMHMHQIFDHWTYTNFKLWQESMYSFEKLSIYVKSKHRIFGTATCVSLLHFPHGKVSPAASLENSYVVSERNNNSREFLSQDFKKSVLCTYLILIRLTN